MSHVSSVCYAAALAGLTLASCTSKRYTAASHRAENVTDVALLSPVALIGYIDRGNRVIPSDSMSSVTEFLLDSLASTSPHLPITHVLEISPDEQTGVLGEVSAIVRQAQARRRRDLSPLPLPPLLDSLVEETGRRYGMALVATGFGRRRGNYGGQVAKSAAVGILTLGMYMPIPVRSNMTLYGVIVDAREDVVVFVDNAVPVERSPCSPSVVKGRLQVLFGGYLHPRPGPDVR